MRVHVHPPALATAFTPSRANAEEPCTFARSELAHEADDVEIQSASGAKCLSMNSRLHSVRRWTAVASWEPCEPTCNRRSSLQSTRRCQGHQPCLPASHMTQHAATSAGRCTPRAVLREHDDERADPRISGGDYRHVRWWWCASHPTAARSAGSLTSTGTRCQSSYQVRAQPR